MSVLRKTIELISPNQKPAMAGLFVLMLFGMVIETVGVGSVLPAVAAMTDPSFGQRLPAWLPMRDVLSAMPTAQLIIFVLFGLVGLFAFKAVFMAFLVSRQASFLYDAQADISRRLFSGYLHQSYAFHLRRNSAQLIRNVTSEATAFTIGALQASMVLLTEGLVAVGLGALLVFIEPVGAVSVILVLGGAGAIFLMFTRKSLKRWGERRQYHEGQRIQHLQQGLGGAKDVKLLGREEHFLSEYDQHNLMVAKLGKREMVVQALPRLWLELLAVLGLAILVFAHLAQGKTMDTLVPTLGVFAAAAYRLVPSANRILNAIQGIRFYQPVVYELHAEQSVVAAPQQRSAGRSYDFSSAIEFRDVSYNYPESTGVALAGLNLVVPKNASVGIVGESGAGKSTLIDVLMGLLTPTAGQVLIDGKDIQGDLRNWQDQFGYVPQAIFLTDDTLRRNIAFGIPEAEIDDAAVQSAIASAQLDAFINSLPDGQNSQVGERGVRLSGGQRQRIGIARALYHHPSVLVLDEATSSLDTATEAEIMRSVRALRDKTVVIVAHRHSTVEHCQIVFRLASGRLIAQGKLDEVMGVGQPPPDPETFS